MAIILASHHGSGYIIRGHHLEADVVLHSAMFRLAWSMNLWISHLSARWISKMLPRSQQAGSATAALDGPATMGIGAASRFGLGAEVWFVPVAVFVTIALIFLSNT